MKHFTKITLIVVLLSTISFSKLFALGAGVQIGAIPSFTINESGIENKSCDLNITGTFRFFRIPAVFGFGFETGSDNSVFTFGATGFFDYWFFDHQLNNTWNIFSGAGLSSNIMFDSDINPILNIGPRFFTGMNWLFLDNYIEYYAQLNIVPTYVKNLTNENNSFKVSIPIETGVRLHF